MAGRIAPLKRARRDPRATQRARGSARAELPLPGIGGYDSPRGKYGEGGFPGSAPAATPTHPQTPTGQRGARQDGSIIVQGVPQYTITEQHRDWATKPRRLPSGLPRNPKARNQPLATGHERRVTPVIGADAPGGEKLRNTIARRVHAIPGEVHSYLPAPNPGKLGGKPARDRSEGYDRDAGRQLGGYPTVRVQVPSRFVSREGAQEGYAVDRPIPLRVHEFPDHYEGDRHLRGAILDGTRYYGAVRDQQRIGLSSDAYGIARRRGPNHRPIRFSQPGAWARNYYDVAEGDGAEAPNMIHHSPTKGRGRSSRHRAPGASAARGRQEETRAVRGTRKRRG